jgi:hypothetical protein
MLMDQNFQICVLLNDRYNTSNCKFSWLLEGLCFITHTSQAHKTRQHNKNFVKNTVGNGIILKNMYKIYVPMTFTGTSEEVTHSDHSLS